MKKKSSVLIAKNRLRQLVTTDRVLCLPDSYDCIRKEIYNTLSKYIDITEDKFRIEIERTRLIIHFTGEDL